MVEFDNGDVKTLTNDENLTSSEGQSEIGADGRTRSAKDKSKVKDTREARRKKEDALEGKEQGHGRSHGSDSEEATHGHGDKGGAAEEETSSHTQQSLQSGQTTVQFSSGANASFSGALTSLLGLFASSAALARVEAGSGIFAINQANIFNFRPIVIQASTLGEFLFEETNKGAGIVNLISTQTAETGGGKFNLNPEVLLTSRSSSSTQEVGLTFITNTISIISKDEGLADATKIPFIEYVGTTYIPTGGTIFFFPATIPFAFGSPTALSGEVATYFSGASVTPPSNYAYNILSPLQIIIPPINNNPPSPIQSAIQIKPDLSSLDGLPSIGNLFVDVGATTVSKTLPTGQSIPKGITFTELGDILINVDKPTSVLINAVPKISPTNVGITFRVDASPVDTTTIPAIGAPNNPNAASPTMSGLPKNPSSDQFSTLGNFFKDSGSDTIVGNSTAFALNVPNASNILAVQLSLDSNDSITFVDRSSLNNFVYTYGLIPGTSVLVGEFNMSSTYQFPTSTIFRHTLAGSSTGPSAATYGNFSSFNNTNINEISYSTIQEVNGLGYNLTFGGNVLDVYGTKYGEGDVLVINLPTSGPSLATNTFYFGGNTLAGFGTSIGDMQILLIQAEPGNNPTNVSDSNFIFRGNLLAMDVPIGSALYPHLQMLDLENVNVGMPPGTVQTYKPANVHITFQGSLIETQNVQGTVNGNIVHSDIQYLSNVNSPHSYTGFIDPVSDVTTNGIEKITTTDGNNNTITFGNNIYTSEYIPNVNHVTPLDINHGAPNTYDITLLGNQGHIPIAEGNSLYLGVNPLIDIINIQLTPDVFRQLDGVVTTQHIKSITAADLNIYASFNQLSNTSLATIDPWFKQYLNSIVPNKSVTGMTINFDNGQGGSLSFIEPTALILPTVDDSGNVTNPLVGGFNDFTNLNIPVNLSTNPVVALPLDQITATDQVNAVPGQTPPFIYGNHLPSFPQAIPYYTELDNFFDNSLLATYQIEGFSSIPDTNITEVSAVEYEVSTGVFIDQFGTIEVTPQATTPILENLTITATNQYGSDSTTQLFGFLFAPTATAAPGIELIGNEANFGSTSNILLGQLNSALVGVGTHTLDSLTQDATDTTITAHPNYGSNLIVDTAGGAIAYGDFKNINLNVLEQGGVTLPSTSTPGPTFVSEGQFLNSHYTFKDNAFYITGGSVYGVDQNFSVVTQGGSNDTVEVSNSTKLTLINTGAFINNTITLGEQTIYGYSGDSTKAFWGDMQTLSFSSAAGLNSTIKITTHSTTAPPITTLDVSSQIEHNDFIFKTVNVVVQGDTAGITTTVYPHLQNLLIGVEPTFSKITASNEIYTATATFANNNFELDDSNITGGMGNLVVFADVNLAPSVEFPSPVTGFTYNGFINPVQVTNDGEHIVTTSNDGSNNSITWGNDTFTSGQGMNTYNFTLLQNAAGINSFNLPNTSAVFTGLDTIKGFHINSTNPDVLVFNLEPTLYQVIAQATGHESLTAQDLDAVHIANFDNTGPDPVIRFNSPTIDDGQGNLIAGPNGTLTLEGVPGPIFSFSDLLTQSPTSLVINEIKIPPISPALATIDATNPFDPVFINLPDPTGQPLAFAGLLKNTNYVNIDYTAQNLPTGMTLDHNGTLHINVTSPQEADVTVMMTDGTTPLTQTVHLFAIDAPFIDYDTKKIVSGDVDGGAYEVQAKIVYGGGGDDTPVSLQDLNTSYGSNLIYDTNSGVDHTIFGDVAHINYATNLNLNGKNYQFNANLMNIGSGKNGTDAIYGVTQSLTIDAPNSASKSVGSDNHPNSFTFGTPGSIDLNNVPSQIQGNTIYGTNNVFADMQTLTLEATSSEHGSITNNQFYFGENKLTSGAYLNGTAVLTAPEGTSASLYAAVGSYVTGMNPTISNNVVTLNSHNPSHDITDSSIYSNALVFSNSTLVAGIGPAQFYTDIADLSGSDFVLPVSVSTTVSGQIMVTDSYKNSITWGNDIFIGNSTGDDTFNITLLADKDHENQAIMQGNLEIKNYHVSDNIILNLAAPLYQAIEINNNRDINSALQSDNTLNQLSQITLAGVTSQGITTYTFDNGLGGSITFDNTFFTTNATHNILQLPNLTVGIAYFAEPITTNTPPSLPILFNNTSTYYSVFDPYFNNVDVTNPDSTYTVSASVSQISFPDANNELTFMNNINNSIQQAAGMNSGVPIVTNNSIPLLEEVNVALNDANFSTNNPSITVMVGVFNNFNNGVIGTTPTGELTTIFGGLGQFAGEQLFEPTTQQASQSAYVFQGNDGATGNNNDSTTLVVPFTNGSSENLTEGGLNMFIDTVDGTIAYGDYQHINFNYFYSYQSPTDIHSVITANKTYDFKTNAFDINGTVLGVSSDLTINVAGEGNQLVINSGPVDGSANIHDNIYHFEGNMIYGSGSLIGDVSNLSINVIGGSNNSVLIGATLDARALFEHNEFDFDANIIDANGSETSNILLGNVDNLSIIQRAGTSNPTIADGSILFDYNTFNFLGDTLVGGQGTNNYFGHMSSFGNSEIPSLYGTNNFYTGVAVDTSNNMVKITDVNHNSITWGNNTYVGNDAATDKYNFTIVGSKAQTSLPIMQGNDIIYKFDVANDKLVFSLVYPIYAAIDTANTAPLTVAQFIAALSPITSTLGGDAVLAFPGGGSITLAGLGSQVTNYSQLDISISVADPITVVANPTSNVFAIGSSPSLTEWESFFNTGHQLNADIAGIHITNGVADFSNVNAGGKDTNTGAISTTVDSITASDLTDTTVVSQNTSPIQILALDGATVIDQSTGDESGTTASEIIIGHGNNIFGGSLGLFYSDANNNTSVSYGSKLIYDIASVGKIVTGDGQFVVYTEAGINYSGSSNSITLHNADVTSNNNYIDIVLGSSVSDLPGQLTFGDNTSISFQATGAVLPTTDTGSAHFSTNITANHITGGNNTIISPGFVAGIANVISLQTVDGYIQNMTSIGQNVAEISNNVYTFGDNHLTGTGTSSFLFGDAAQLKLEANAPSNTALYSGNGLIDNNHFIFGSNELEGSSSGGTLYAGIGQYEAFVFDASMPHQNQHSAVFDNTVVFGDSHLTANGGITKFYGDIGDFSNTAFDTDGLSFANNTPHGVYTYQDNQANTITFGHDTFTGSTAAGAVNIFNVNLFVSEKFYLLDQEAMAPGLTTIENFSAPGSQLNLVLSKALDTIITGNASGTAAVTASMLDSYLNTHFGVTFDTSGGNTTIQFLGTENLPHTSIQLGSITLDNTHYTSFANMGSKLQITVGDPITTMSSTPGSPDVFNVNIPGDSLSSFHDTTNIQNLDSMGHIIDFNGTINLNMSNALFKELGLSDTNTTAQNMQILQNDLNSSTGGIAVTSTTAGAGANAVTNTVLNLEAIHNGVTATFGTITLTDTHFNPLNPLVNHLNIVHH